MKPSNDREAISLIIDGLIERGCVITNVWDGAQEKLPYTDKDEAVDWLTSCDDSTMEVTTPEGQESWVYFVLGNEPEEVACDMGVNILPYLDPITEPWWA